MRNVFLSLLLANLLLLAWSRWVTPLGDPPGATRLPPLADFRASPVPEVPGVPAGTPVAATGAGAVACVRIGPLAAAEAAAGLSQSIENKGFKASAEAREGRAWVGHWVHVDDLGSADEAATARARLVAGGLADAYAMQEGESTVVSLGVFRDRAGADRVAAAARRLGFAPRVSDRYRQAVEYWVVAVLPPDSILARDALGAPGAQILRVEGAECPAPAGDGPP